MGLGAATSARLPLTLRSMGDVLGAVPPPGLPFFHGSIELTPRPSLSLPSTSGDAVPAAHLRRVHGSFGKTEQHRVSAHRGRAALVEVNDDARAYARTISRKASRAHADSVGPRRGSRPPRSNLQESCRGSAPSKSQWRSGVRACKSSSSIAAPMRAPPTTNGLLCHASQNISVKPK